MIPEIHNPLVSVIIPVYNTEKYLAECLESVISQTYKFLEILVIDDGSTDSSGEICDRFAARDERIKIIHKDNKGRSAARNDGLDLMTGEYFTFVDADDILLREAIELLVKALSGNTDLVIARIVEFLPDMKKTTSVESGRMKRITQNEALECFALDNMHGGDKSFEIKGAVYSKLYCAKLKDIRFPEDLSYAEDYLYTLTALLRCELIEYLDRVVYRYRRYYEEENHFWKGFRTYSLEGTEARIRALKLVRESREDIFEDFLLRSYYSILDAFCTCTRLGYSDSAKKISEVLDEIKDELKNSSSYRSLNHFSKIKLKLSFFSYGLYAFLYEGHNMIRRNKG